ncbi:Mrp/NBP35 family ATP-binding protein [bacterium]|nr:Mrp/NBP35 family ATP-binding protein [bacterium]
MDNSTNDTNGHNTPENGSEGRVSPFASGGAGREALGLDQTAPPPGQPPAMKAGSKTMQLLEQLKRIKLPGMEQDIVSAGLVKNLNITEGLVKFNVVLEKPGLDIEDYVEQRVADELGDLSWIQECELGFLAGPPPGGIVQEMLGAPGGPAGGQIPFGGPAAGAGMPARQSSVNSEIDAAIGDDSAGAAGGVRAAQVSGASLQAAEMRSARFDAAHGPATAPQLENVRHVIAVGSGKGGVGKSTVAVNLALALLQNGFKVGLLDADVYGPSVPLMLGINEQPYVNDNEKLVPPELYGMKVMSIGLLLAPDQAVIWRGPMIHGVMKQFLGDVDWGNLDYLIIDLPPGTGDAPLSISQALPLTSAIVVTTPQEVASSVAQKSIAMFQRMGIQVLGLIENMSYFICPSCEEQHDIFGRGGAQRIAEAHGLPVLGEIPLDTRMRQGGDTGHPVLLQHPRSELAEAFRVIAARLAEQVRASETARP